MFQFTDDDDPDVEGLFDLPLDKSTNKCELDSTKRLQADNLKDILDDCDDNDLILSMIDNVDSSLINQPISEEISSKTSFENVGSIANSCSTSLNNPCFGSNRICIAMNNVKHKSTSNELCTSSTKAPKIEYERKFPGPAGLIPKKSKTAIPIKYQTLPDGSPKQADIPSNKTDYILENGCWNQLIKDIEKISPILSIMNENTVASVRTLNIICSKPRKLQFFAAQIVNIDVSARDPSVVLKDSTGEIHGTLHKELWETYEDLLTVGTVLLMKQVSVFNITNSRKLYVNVTSNNILKIYTPRSGGPVLVTEAAKSSDLNLLQVNSNKRLVFEETRPNAIHSHIKEVAIHKPSLSSISKADSVITSCNEKAPHQVKSRTKTEILVHSMKSIDIIPTQNEAYFDKLLDDVDVDSFLGQNERQVFKETHPNVPNYVKEAPSCKPAISSVSKTDCVKTIRNENTPHQFESKTKIETFVCPVKSINKIQIPNKIIFDELEGIDADSLFGEF